ncbi:hypothetical protein HanIR_Chr07g0301591 [Helianthus annuus]|nr:hypothetical protein HanIR_Chr07g0301591 [Helianthus annuus]
MRVRTTITTASLILLHLNLARSVRFFLVGFESHLRSYPSNPIWQDERYVREKNKRHEVATRRLKFII